MHLETLKDMPSEELCAGNSTQSNIVVFVEQILCSWAEWYQFFLVSVTLCDKKPLKTCNYIYHTFCLHVLPFWVPTLHSLSLPVFLLTAFHRRGYTEDYAVVQCYLHYVELQQRRSHMHNVLCDFLGSYVLQHLGFSCSYEYLFSTMRVLKATRSFSAISTASSWSLPQNLMVSRLKATLFSSSLTDYETQGETVAF